MSSKKIIAVTMSTGAQGYSVARSLLDDGTFAVRGLTRNVESAKAKEMAKLGIEMVQADNEDVESLTAAFKGAYGVYGVTVWDLFPRHAGDGPATRDHETQHAKNQIDAAKKVGVQHFVWSTLDAFEGFEVFHFTSKHNANAYLAASGIPHWTLLYTSCYFSNFTNPGFSILQKKEGHLDIAFPITPDALVDWYDAHETGIWALPAFKNPEKYSGARIDAAGERLSIRQIAKAIEAASGIPVHVPEVTKEEFHSAAFRASTIDEVWLNTATWVDELFKRDYEQSKAVAITGSKSGNPPRTFEEFLKADKVTREFLGLK